MADLKDFYSAGTGKEISLRDEFEATFDGTSIEETKKQPCLIRVMRKDANGKKIVCGCVSPTTGEPEKDRFCPICLAEGFLWDEEFSDMYTVLLTPKQVLLEGGLTDIPLVIFYMRHDTNVTKDDKVIELVLDLEGIAVKPIQRKNVFRIQHLQPLRLDKGRMEFLKLWTYKEDVKHLNVS